MNSSDLAQLRMRARSGDSKALTALGRRLLTGDGVPASPQEGIGYIRDAAARGDGEATAQLALFAAWGVFRARDVDEALDLLQRAAELGWQASRRELQFLARREGSDWPSLRKAVDVAAWTRSPPLEVLREQPLIRSCPGFATPAECDWLIALARHGLRRAQVYRKDAAGHVESASRTNSEANYVIGHADIVLNLVRARLAAAAGVPARFFEIAKLLHYEPGQEFAPHCDFQDPATPALQQEVARHGQRVATVLVYLNDDYAGGETDFPKIGLRFKGARGDALLFPSVRADGSLNYDTLHAGLPPASGVKWVLSQWIRDKAVGAD